MLDRQTRKVERVSVSSAGAQAQWQTASYPTVSADGRYVVFHSDATNLVTGDTNGKNDVFVRDRTAQTTTRVSLGSSGTQLNKTSRTARSPPTAATSPSNPWPPTSSPATPTAHRCLRPRPARRHDAPGQPGLERRDRQRPVHRHFISAVGRCRVRFERHRPGPGRHQPPDRHLFEHALSGLGRGHTARRADQPPSSPSRRRRAHKRVRLAVGVAGHDVAGVGVEQHGAVGRGEAQDAALVRRAVA